MDNRVCSELDGRLALVTGAAAGIGRGIASVLSRHGAAVACVDLTEEATSETARRIGEADGKSRSFAHDVADWAKADYLFQRVEESFGQPVDVVVNNAGLYFNKPFEELSDYDHEKLYSVNVGGVFAMCRAAVRSMKLRRFGKIVNIASISGRDPFAQSASYGSSKAAVIGLTKSLAKEFAPYNINVNAVCPGFVHTNMQVEQCRKISAATGRPAEEIWKERVSKVPLQRAQEPDDIGETVAFLASERARNITGQGISVCGGLQMVG